eukprot:SAG31_NODE_1069_length_10077_cov_2.403588_7_plen_202_part_00
MGHCCMYYTRSRCTSGCSLPSLGCCAGDRICLISCPTILTTASAETALAAAKHAAAMVAAVEKLAADNAMNEEIRPQRKLNWDVEVRCTSFEHDFAHWCSYAAHPQMHYVLLLTEASAVPFHTKRSRWALMFQTSLNEIPAPSPIPSTSATSSGTSARQCSTVGWNACHPVSKAWLPTDLHSQQDARFLVEIEGQYELARV